MPSSIVILEIFCFCLGGVLFVYSTSRRVSESLSLGIVLGLILLSIIFQISFLLQAPQFSFLLEILLITIIIRYAAKNYLDLREILITIKHFFLQHKIIVSIIGICWIYLFLLATIIPPANYDSMTYNLARVLLFQQENSLFLSQVTTSRQALFVIGSDILSHAFLRFYSDYGVGLFSFLAYLSIGLGTYALSRNFFSTQISLLATLVIISMPELCFQATSTKNDIVAAAVAIFCFISACRLFKNLNKQDLMLMILGLAFGLSTKITFLVFTIPFMVVFGYLIIKKYGLFQVLDLITDNYLYFFILISPVLTVHLLWLLFNNNLLPSNSTSNTTKSMLISFDDIIISGIANLTRYCIQSIHLFPLSDILRVNFSINIDVYLTELYNFIFKPIFGNEGLGYFQIGNEGYIPNHPRPFVVNSISHEDWSWYGISGFLIILPSVFTSIFRSNAMVRAIGLTLLGYLIIICFGIYWTPWNNRYLTLFFSTSGLCVACFINNFDFQNHPTKLRFIQAILIVLLIFSCFFNETKPFGRLSSKNFLSPNIWLQTNFGADRFYYVRKHYQDDRIEQFIKLVPDKSKVAILSTNDSWIYPFYLVGQQIELEPIQIKESSVEHLEHDYILCLDWDCDKLPQKPDFKALWTASQDVKRKGKIIKIISE